MLPRTAARYRITEQRQRKPLMAKLATGTLHLKEETKSPGADLTDKKRVASCSEEEREDVKGSRGGGVRQKSPWLHSAADEEVAVAHVCDWPDTGTLPIESAPRLSGSTRSSEPRDGNNDRIQVDNEPHEDRSSGGVANAAPRSACRQNESDWGLQTFTANASLQGSVLRS